jgi:hypothetical protein
VERLRVIDAKAAASIRTVGEANSGKQKSACSAGSPLTAMLQVRQIKAARSLIGWEQFELATRSGVAISTIRRLEGLKGPIACHVDAIVKIQKAFENTGIMFTSGPHVGVYLRAPE